MFDLMGCPNCASLEQLFLPQNIQRMLSAAGDIAESSNNLLRIVGATAIDSASVETAKTLMAVVAASAATLTAEARKLGQGLDDPGLQIDFNDSVTVCAVEPLK